MTEDQAWRLAREAGLLVAAPGTNAQDAAIFKFARLLGIDIKATGAFNVG